MIASSGLVAAAQAGDSSAFEALFAPEMPRLRSVIRRLVGHPDDVEELAQQSLIRAWEKLAGFRGEARPGTWLCSIGVRLAIDHLRAKRRWREQAQLIFAARCLDSAALGQLVGNVFADPAFSYDVGEHIAFCFTCVGRTLEPEAQAALVLRDVLGLTNAEAAKALGLTRSVLRHHLSDARKTMQERFEGLCALVSKDGVCWQCAGLRQASPEGKRGEEPPNLVAWSTRLSIVAEAALDEGASRRLHDVFFRAIDEQEQCGAGDTTATTSCGRPE